MKIVLTEFGPRGEDGEQYVYTTRVTVRDSREAYEMGREFSILTTALALGAVDEAVAILAARQESQQ